MAVLIALTSGKFTEPLFHREINFVIPNVDGQTFAMRVNGLDESIRGRGRRVTGTRVVCQSGREIDCYSLSRRRVGLEHVCRLVPEQRG